MSITCREDRYCMPSDMGKFKIRSVASLAAFVVIVLSLAGACNGSGDSNKTTSVIGSVMFDCNACSEQLLAFSGAHVAIKCLRGNDLSANGAGSVNADGSFAIHVDKVESGDLCSAEVAMPNNKLCSLAKTRALSPLEKLSFSTPLMCNDAENKLDQKFSRIHPPIPKPNFKLSINFPKFHVTPKFLTVTKSVQPNDPLDPQFFEKKPLPKLPPLPPIFKPKPFPKHNFLKSPPPFILKPKPFLKPKPKPNFLKSPPPLILKPKPFLKPKLPKDPLTSQFFKTKPLPKLPPLSPIFKPKPSPKPDFFKPKPFSKPNFFKPKPLFKPPPLSPILKPKVYLKPKFFKPKPLFKPLPILEPKPLPKPKFFKPKPIPKLPPKLKFFESKPLPKLPPKPKFFKTKPLPKLPPKPKFFKPPSPKPKFPSST